MYPLNQEALALFREWRSSGERDSQDRKLKPLTKRAETRAMNILMRVPEHVQMGMVKRSMEKGWSDVYIPKNTLGYDLPDAPKRTNENLPDNVASIIDQGYKEIPKPEKRDPEVARRALSELADMLELKKGSDQDPEFKKNWLDATLKHAEAQK